MAKTKISLIILLLPLCLFAGNIEAGSVWFSPETPYLVEINKTLEANNYRLQSDSLKAEFRGELLFYLLDKDSIRCEIELSKGDNPSFVIGSFNTEPESQKNVRSSVLKFSIWMLILNALTAILFFSRST